MLQNLLLALPEGWKTVGCYQISRVCLLLRIIRKEYMRCGSKEYVSKFNSKSEKLRSESPFFKHLMNNHGGKADDKEFSDYFEAELLKAYKKPFKRLVE